jgi:hypothetical protein
VSILRSRELLVARRTVGIGSNQLLMLTLARSSLLPGLLVGSSLCPLAPAQATIVQSVSAPVAKVVVHDYGSFWPGALVRHVDGTVSALGNPWLGGGQRSLALAGVNDMARLDALTPGALEKVLAVDSGGLRHVVWNPTTGEFSTPLIDAGAAGGLMVRSAPFSPHHIVVVVVVADGGTSLRCYRNTTLVSTPTVAGPVRDLEIFRHANAAARFVVRNDAGISCLDPSGTVLWSRLGCDGCLARWPQPASARFAWVHREGATSPWRVALFDDDGLLCSHDLSSLITASDTIVAAFAVNADGDADVELIVKTSAGVFVFDNLTGPTFSPSLEFTVTELQYCATSVPDLVATSASGRLRLVDQVGTEGLSWRRIDFVHSLGGNDELSLETHVPVGGGAPRGAWAPGVPSPATALQFALRASPSALEPFAAQWTQIQVVTWRQREPNVNGRLDTTSESNEMWRLLPLPQWPPVEDTVWPLEVVLAPPFAGGGWNTEDHYWLTMRVCSTATNSTVPAAVSEPITLLTTLSTAQHTAGWTFMHEYVTTPGELPVIYPLTGPIGGGVVGVIQRPDKQPPPPPGGIPSPVVSSGQHVSQGSVPSPQ